MCSRGPPKSQTCCVPTCAGLCVTKNIAPLLADVNVPLLAQAVLIPATFQTTDTCITATFTGSLSNPSDTDPLTVVLNLATDVSSFIDTLSAGPLVTLPAGGQSVPASITISRSLHKGATLVVLTLVGPVEEGLQVNVQGVLTVTSC